MKKLIFPVILPILFVLSTKSIFKPGFELPSIIVVGAMGLIFGCLVSYSIFPRSGDQTEQKP